MTPMSPATSLLDSVGVALTLLLAAPASLVLAETVAYGVIPKRALPVSAVRPRLAVVMPAHNEALGIAPSIASVLGQLGPEDRLVVVADNCSDETAAVARQLGALVVERRDAERRGKGYALDFGLRSLDGDPPDIVLIVDADCVVRSGALERLARAARALRRPVQALYLMRSPERAGLKTRIAEFAWLMKNQVRPGGAGRLGLPCHLMGTGMAFPWEIARDLAWASGHLVEDMELGVELALAGQPPVFCEEALVESRFPEQTEGLRTQRTRWEHGHFSIIKSHAPRLLFRGIQRFRPSLVLFALDLAVPPLASFVLLQLLALLVGGSLAFFFGAFAPLWCAVTVFLAFSSAIFLGWALEGRKAVSLGELAGVPWYVLGKLPVYAKLFGKKQNEWVRTKRDVP